jgi:signal transduction histidine kinase
MARGIAHEIRTPLTIASSAAQFLTEENLAPEFHRECAEKVHSGIRKASTIIENLLRFAHPTTNTNKTPVDLPSVVNGALSIVENQAKVQNIEVRRRLPPETGRVLGVHGLLEQVFMNLFLNAMNAMPNGGTLDVSAQRRGGDLLVRVTDTGDGISPEDLDRIFDPFYTKALPGKGTGLGLSICHAIVDQHQGSIAVESRIGKGSAFTVRLPLLVPSDQAKP